MQALTVAAATLSSLQLSLFSMSSVALFQQMGKICCTCRGWIVAYHLLFLWTCDIADAAVAASCFS